MHGDPAKANVPKTETETARDAQILSQTCSSLGISVAKQQDWWGLCLLVKKEIIPSYYRVLMVVF